MENEVSDSSRPVVGYYSEAWVEPVPEQLEVGEAEVGIESVLESSDAEGILSPGFVDGSAKPSLQFPFQFMRSLDVEAERV